MTFLHLWPIYLGALAAAVPLAVHWLTRPRPRKMPLSTLRFVREMAEQRRARNRLRDFLILALRVAAVLLLAWAVARPLLRTGAAEAPGEVGNVARVVLLDVSQSMAASQGGIEAFERARARAAEHFAFERGLRANLIRAGATARPAFDHLSNNQGALRDELARTRVQPQRLNIQPALALAAQIFADESSESSRRELIVISDFQRTSWANADFSVLPADTKIELESVAPGRTAGKHGRVGSDRRRASGARQAKSAGGRDGQLLADGSPGHVRRRAGRFGLSLGRCLSGQRQNHAVARRRARRAPAGKPAAPGSSTSSMRWRSTTREILP